MDDVNDSPTPEQFAECHRVYQAALRHRDLVPASICSWCGSGGRIHGHHPDYNRPLMVVWICASCHRRHHACFEDVPAFEDAVEEEIYVLRRAFWMSRYPRGRGNA